jgi:hydrogenase maturation protease
LGLGNPAFGDDGLGVLLAESLRAVRAQSADPLEIVVAGNTPEHWVGRIADAGFDNVVFVDAVDVGAPPGSVVLMDSGETRSRFPAVSTHKTPLGLLARVVEAGGTTKAWVLGVQPGSMALGAGLSPPVRTSIEALSSLVAQLYTEVDAR